MSSVANNTLSMKVVRHTEWVEARKKLLAKEKEFSRLRDDLSRQRREMPWEKVEKPYVFDGPRGKEKLADLFEGRSQLIVYHFMLGPDWKEGCPSCSFLADTFDGAAVHMAQRDVSFVAISRGRLAEIEAFKKRMGWRFKWLSSFGTDFNFDYQVSARKEELGKGKVYYNYDMTSFPSEERPGLSVFYKDEAGDIFHTYSTYARGLDMLLTAYNFLDLTPKGRDEEQMKPHAMAWVRHHDRYGNSPSASCCSGEELKKMPAAMETLLAEVRNENATTRRVLERVPAGNLAWKPNPRSMSLGTLALHIAGVPGRLATVLQGTELNVDPASFQHAEPKSLAEIKDVFEQSVRTTEDFLRSLTDESALANFQVKVGGKTRLDMPRIELVRMIMMNHIYHHRGQLSVYLSMLNVPVPSIYGPSRDEVPAAWAND